MAPDPAYIPPAVPPEPVPTGKGSLNGAPGDEAELPGVSRPLWGPGPEPPQFTPLLVPGCPAKTTPAESSRQAPIVTHAMRCFITQLLVTTMLQAFDRKAPLVRNVGGIADVLAPRLLSMEPSRLRHASSVPPSMRYQSVSVGTARPTYLALSEVAAKAYEPNSGTVQSILNPTNYFLRSRANNL